MSSNPDFSNMYRNEMYNPLDGYLTEEDAPETKPAAVEVRQTECKKYSLSMLVADERIRDGMRSRDILGDLQKTILQKLERKMAEQGLAAGADYTVEFRTDPDPIRMATRLTAIATTNGGSKMYFGIDMARQPEPTGYIDRMGYDVMTPQATAELAAIAKEKAAQAAEAHAKLIANLSKPDVVQRNAVLLRLEVS